MSEPSVALVTYSTKPRGGVVHTIELAEALQHSGYPVHIVALGDPGAGFFRPSRVPHTILSAPPPAPTLEQRVVDATAVLAGGLQEVAGRFEILHAQDCIAARAAVRVRDGGAALKVVRTVHHVDEFTTPMLVDCQRRSILEPDHIVVPSDYWRRVLRDSYGVNADVVTNGVDFERFRRPSSVDPLALRRQLGALDRFLFLSVGGVEPRKGSFELLEAMATLCRTVSPSPVLAVVGGHSFQDHSPYREAALARASSLGLRLGRDVVLVGTVPHAELASWYHAVDAFVMPSRVEGWGLAVVEALAAARPVVASDIEVFRSYLQHERTALLVPVGDAAALAAGLRRIMTDGRLRSRLATAGPRLAQGFTWQACAARHREIYAGVASGAPAGGPDRVSSAAR